MTTILRWLLSHLLLLIFVALGVTAWLNRDQLRIEAILEDLRTPVAEHKQAGVQEAERAPAPDATPVNEVQALPEGERVEAKTEAASRPLAPRQDSEAVMARAASPVAEGVAQGPAAVSDSASEKELADHWYAARRAYWDADLAQAERLYQQLIVENPDKPDAYGELGNLYYSQGAWVKAAKMYHQAALLLVDQGEPLRAASLVGILSALNPNFADDLQERLDKGS